MMNRVNGTLAGLLLVCLLLGSGVVYYGCSASAGDSPAERGRYLVTAMACNDCHTPWQMGPQGPEPDMSRMLSGHPQDFIMPDPPATTDGAWLWHGSATNTAFAGPWGISYAANLTPDKFTGLGMWTEENFIQTIRTGKHMGSAPPIMPPMPWPQYAQLTDADLKAIFAYLQTIPTIANQVPQKVPAPVQASMD